MYKQYNDIKNIFFTKQETSLIKKNGQFFTPISVVEYMMQFFPKGRNITVLDPAFGLGIFPLSLLQRYNHQIKQITAYEIDENLKEYNNQLYSNSEKLVIDYCDFLLSEWETKYDFIIANPPYYKHHYIENKKEIQKNFKEKTGYDFDITTNIYIWFLIKAINQLLPDGKLVFIVPSEFLNANYGKKVKQYLLDKNVIERIVKFDFSTDVFDDAITTSCILFIDNAKQSDEIIFSNLVDLNDLKSTYDKLESFTYKLRELDCERKWQIYFKKQEDLTDKNLVSFSKFAKVKRGIATGDNNYFVFNNSKAKKYNISSECLTKCICKASLLQDIPIITDEIFTSLIEQDQDTFLFDGEKGKTKFDSEYIEYGESLAVHKKFLTAKRTPWYRLEKRSSADLLVGVFNRKALRFILNESDSVNLTCFHSIYLEEHFKPFKHLLYLYLNCPVSYELFILEKREFGNGLSKFEPNDINKAHIINFLILQPADMDILNFLAEEYIKSLDQELINQANKIFKSYIFK